MKPRHKFEPRGNPMRFLKRVSTTYSTIATVGGEEEKYVYRFVDENRKENSTLWRDPRGSVRRAGTWQ